jgi:hypothetical protein
LNPARTCGVNKHRGFQAKETLMYRIVAMAVIALAAVALPAETSLAFGPGSGAGAFGAPIARIAPAASRVAPKPGGGPATPHAKKLSGKGGRRASAPACMGCPARAGAISAIIPVTATDSSHHGDFGGPSANDAPVASQFDGSS